MRIGISFQCKDSFPSGVEYYSLGLIEALARYEPQNEYVVITNAPDLLGQYVANCDGIRVVRARYRFGRVGRILWEHRQLPRLAERLNLDVLHCPSYVCPITPSKIPYVVTVHDTIALDHPEWCTRLNSVYYGRLLRKSVKTAASIAVVSSFTGEMLKKHVALSEDRMSVVYPGIDEPFCERLCTDRLNSIRTRYSLPDRYLLHVGNVEPKKSLSTLLEAHRRVRGHGLPHKLVLVGKRAWRSRAVLRKIREQEHNGSIVPAGYVDRKDLPGVYQMADVYVCPSICEGFGFPPLEAMACGTPVISTECGSLGETLGNAALRVVPSNPAQLTDHIVRLLTDSELRDRYVQLGYLRSRLFSWERCASAMQSIYESVSRAAVA